MADADSDLLEAAEFADTKASVLGEYIPARLGMEEGETVLYMAAVQKYAGYMLFFFENGTSGLRCSKDRRLRPAGC